MPLNDNQINAICFLVLNKTYGIDPNPELYQEYLDILKPGKKDVDVVGSYSQKGECITHILSILIDGKDIDYALGEISQSPKWNASSGMLESILAYRDDGNNLQGDGKETKKKCLDIIDGLSKYRCVMDHVDEFKEMYEIFTVTGGTGREMFQKMVEFNDKIGESIQKAENTYANNTESTVVLGKDGDDLIPVLERTLAKFDRKNKIPSGFNYLDDKILDGGFDQTRLYTFAGNSGSGKSTILINMALNAATYNQYIGDLDVKLKIFLYITLENDIEESFERLYCSRYDVSSIQFRRSISINKEDVSKRIDNDLNRFNSKLILKHFAAGTLTVPRLDALIKNLEEENGGSTKCKVAAIYVDYLDLLKADSSTKDLRLQLNETTQNLKEVARRFRLPVITATQLNRESYTAKSAHTLNASMIAESIGKIFVTDFAGLLVKSEDDGIVFFRVGKNRSGSTGKPMNFKVNFEHFKFIECVELESKKLFKGISPLENPTELNMSGLPL